VQTSGADAVTTARATRGGMRYDHDLQKTLYAFGFFDAENDLLQLLDLRTVAGAGAGAAMGGVLGVQSSMLLDLWAERKRAAVAQSPRE